MSRGDGGRNVERRVLDALAASSKGPLNADDVAGAVGGVDGKRVNRALTGLERAGKVYKVKGNRYALPDSMDLVVGSASLTRSGDAFIRPEAPGDDLFVPGVNLATAMDGDRVVARIESRPKNRSPVARIIKILERAHETTVGTLHRGKKMSYVVPLDRRLSRDVLIPSDEQAGAEDGDVVVVRYVSYGEGNTGPVGAVHKVLGKLSDPGVDVLAVAYSYGLVLDFPSEVLQAAQAAATHGMEEPGEGRLDRTDLLVMTIDPADAKDHDDALSIERLEDGTWEVGIHIADVGHYVPEGGPVDVEAFARGTSVYLVDRTIPMLPERLSGDVCSLREGVVRFAVSVFVRLDGDGHSLGQRFEKTAIRSRKRLSYEQVEEVLDGDGSIDPEVDRTLRQLDDVARTVRKERLARGALDLDLPEARVILDSEGQPLDIQRVQRLESHRLVEDFMILANETVAGACEARSLPVLYRVHEAPTREKAEELREFLASLGHRMPKGQTLRPRDVQKLLDAVRGRREEHLVSIVVLRSMKRARYDARNLGHFGLASTAYLHFTSPIRRYPDLVVHREVVRTLIDGEPARKRETEEVQAVGDQASARSQAADDAQRDSVALKKVEFMERHLGGEFDGRISGVQAFGFFVTLDDFYVDGLVHVNTLKDDFYRFREESYTLVGDRGRKTYTIGERVTVQVTRVDKESRHVDFLLVRKLRREV